MVCKRYNYAAFCINTVNLPYNDTNYRVMALVNAKETPKGKGYRKVKQPVTGDLFTTICKTDLGVECVREYKFHSVRRWRFDYAIPAYKIALEVEGGVWVNGRHTRPKGFLGDIEKYNMAAVMGWRVLRVTPSNLYKAATLKMLREAIGNSVIAV